MRTNKKSKKVKERTRGFVAGAIVSVLLLGITGTALAVSDAINIDIYPTKLLVNNEVFQPKDVNGNDVMVFIHNGTTYAPVRALAEAYGLEVGWDAASGTATVTAPEKVAEEETPTAEEPTSSDKTNQNQFPTKENFSAISSQFVMIDGKLYECRYVFPNYDDYLRRVDGSPAEFFFKVNKRGFEQGNLFAFLTGTYRTMHNENPFVDGAINALDTGYITTINVEIEKQYISATSIKEIYTHEYNGKTLTIPELSDGAQIVDGIRYYDGFVSLNDYCDYFGINAEIKVEYNESVGTNILVIEHD